MVSALTPGASNERPTIEEVSIACPKYTVRNFGGRMGMVVDHDVDNTGAVGVAAQMFDNGGEVEMHYPSVEEVRQWAYELRSKEVEYEAHRADQAVEDGLKHNRMKTERLDFLRADRDAKRELRMESEPAVEPFDAGMLAELLARPEEPAERVAGLIPSDSSTLLVAQRKTGKTTMTMNYARSLLTGEPFLGRFEVIPAEGIVTLLNYEVSWSMIARWAHEVGVPEDRLYIVNVRGRRNPLVHDEDREKLARDLRERGTEVLIVDPFGRAFTGSSQNDTAEVGQWLVNLDLFARAEVGATDLMLTTHAGWAGERARGSSAQEDWADSIIYMTRSQDKDDPHRFMSAITRVGELDEDRLDYDPMTRQLTLSGYGSRKKHKDESKNRSLSVFILRALREQPGLNRARLVEAVREMDDAPAFQNADIGHAAKWAEKQGLLKITPMGSGKPTLHHLTPAGEMRND